MERKIERTARAHRLIIQMVGEKALSLDGLLQEFNLNFETPISSRTLDNYIAQIRKGLILDPVDLIFHDGRYYIDKPQPLVEKEKETRIKWMESQIRILRARVQILEQKLSEK